MIIHEASFIRQAAGEDIQRILSIWEKAVRGSHFFLTEADVIKIRADLLRDLPTYIGSIWVFEDGEGAFSGFIRITPDDRRICGRGRVEMLFVEPESQRKGVGAALLNFAKDRFDSLELEVNQDNPSAEKFYLSQGFVFLEKLPLDLEGRPFPLSRLIWTKET
jgi:putative acetyltransferase